MKVQQRYFMEEYVYDVAINWHSQMAEKGLQWVTLQSDYVYLCLGDDEGGGGRTFSFISCPLVLM